MSAQESAEVIFIVIKRLFKWLLFLFVGLITVCLILWGIYELWDYYNYGRHKKKVAVIAEFGSKECPGEDYPLFVLVGNASAKKVKRVTFYLEVTMAGRSTKLNNYEQFSSDKILDTDAGEANCYRVLSSDYTDQKTLDGKGMDVKVTSYNVEFLN